MFCSSTPGFILSGQGLSLSLELNWQQATAILRLQPISALEFTGASGHARLFTQVELQSRVLNLAFEPSLQPLGQGLHFKIM